MQYRLTVSIAYEGDMSETLDTLDEVKDYIQKRGYYLDDITIEAIAYTVDVYELMKQ